MVHNKIIWTETEINFLKENYKLYTNAVLFDKLNKTGIRPTSVRHKLYELGLYKMQLEYWTAPMVKFLTANYKKIGDSEIAEIFNKKFPKNKGWTKKHIEKKTKVFEFEKVKSFAKKNQRAKSSCWSLGNWK